MAIRMAIPMAIPMAVPMAIPMSTSISALWLRGFVVLVFVGAVLASTDHVILKQRIRINNNNNNETTTTARIEKRLTTTAELLTFEVNGSCTGAAASLHHVSALVALDGVIIKSYVLRCGAAQGEGFHKVDQICANESHHIRTGLLSIVVLGAASSSMWTVTSEDALRFNGTKVQRHLLANVEAREDAGITGSENGSTLPTLPTARGQAGWRSVKVLQVDVDFSTDKILQFTVTSNEDGIGLLVVSRDCASTIDPNILGDADTAENAMHLTFRSFGRVTVSRNSRPAIGNGVWFVHILVKANLAATKNISISIESVYDYPSGQIFAAAILSLLFGVLIASLYYVLVSDLPGPREMLPHVKAGSLWATFTNWFKRGNKTFSYITAIFAITFAVGGYQVVHGNWNQMISTGNRDICFYNEYCYIPSELLPDFPFNLLSSNIPYMVHAAVIFVLFFFREAYCFSKKHFGYYNYSLAYAIAWSFLFEGIFSTIYHKCPTRMIFQFDTAFMFTISSLIVACLFNHYSLTDEDILLLHNRVVPAGFDLRFCQTKALRAPKIFIFFLAPLLLFNYIGSIRDVGELSLANEVVASLFLITWFSLLIVWGAFKLELVPRRLNAKPKLKDPRIAPLKRQTLTYFTSDFSTAKVHSSSAKHKDNKESVIIVPETDSNRPSTDATKKEPPSSRLQSWCRLVFSLPTMYFAISGLLLVWLLLSLFLRRDMSLFFLGTCIGSVFVAMMTLEFTIIRSSSRRMLKAIRNSSSNTSGNSFARIRQTRTAMKIVKVLLYYSIIGVVWVLAGVFFIGMETSDKSLSPSSNRDLNRPCLLLDFYDSHDVWHFLSSCALLLCAIRAIALSYPCRHCRFESFQASLERDVKRFPFKEKVVETIKTMKIVEAMKGKVKNPGIVETATPAENVAFENDVASENNVASKNITAEKNVAAENTAAAENNVAAESVTAE